MNQAVATVKAGRWVKPRWRVKQYRSPFEAYVRYGGWRLCEIKPGTKAPAGKGWNRREAAIDDPARAGRLEAAGLLHAWSGTAALDVDDFEEADRWLEARGINLSALLGSGDAVQITSGRPGKAKLLYRLAEPRPSVKVVDDAGQVVLELRCGAAGGLSVQDVLPPSVHPDTGNPYAWGGSGRWWRLPDMPAALLKVWDELAAPSHRPDEVAKAEAAAAVLDAGQLADLREALFFIPADAYDTWIKIGLALAGLGDAGRALWLAWSATSSKFEPAAAARKWESFAGAAADHRAVFAEAARRGWTNPAKERAVRERLAAQSLAEAGGPAAAGKREEVQAVPAVEVGGAGWPEPMIPEGVDVPNIPDIVLPGWVGAMAEAVSVSCQTPSAAAVAVALAALATCCQRRWQVAPHASGYVEPLALWTITAMPPGSRKSAVLAALAAPLIRWEKLQRDRLRPEIARRTAAREVAAKRIEGLKKRALRVEDAESRAELVAAIQSESEFMPAELIPPRLFTGDCTPERLQGLLVEHGEAMSVLSDEGGIFQVLSGAYSGGMANLDVFLQGHAGSAMRVDRGGRCAHIDRPALSLGLMMQPGVLAEVGKNKRFRDSGLLGRCLFVVPKSNVGARDVRQHLDVPEYIKEDWEAGLFRLLDGRLEPVEAPRTLIFGPEARECWLNFSAEIERKQGDGGPLGHVADWSAKLPGAVARIAGLLHLATRGGAVEVIGRDAVERAVELGKLLIPHALAAFGLMGRAPVEDDAHALLAWIRAGRRLTFTAREAQRAMRVRFPSRPKLDQALAFLGDWKVVVGARQTVAGGGAGRPTTTYIVNERIFDAA